MSTSGERTERALQWCAETARRAGAKAAALAKQPVRLLVVVSCVVLLLVAVPLLATSAMRLERAWTDFRHERTVDESWQHTSATVKEMRANDGLDLRLEYKAHGKRTVATAHVENGAADWIGTKLAIRYDPSHPTSIELLGGVRARPLGSLLVGIASLAAALAVLVFALGLWRRRALIPVSAAPLSTLRRPATVAAGLLVVGLGAWAAGTVVIEGWSGVADGIGNGASTVFGDFLRVTVPLIAFALGCLVTAWLARHRHHDRHVGLLSNAHRIIDRAAGYVPSPEELRVETGKKRTGGPEPQARADSADRTERPAGAGASGSRGS
jgi:hypothetical protein